MTAPVNNLPDNSTPKRNLSRRDFLKLLKAFAIELGLGAIGLGYVSQLEPNFVMLENVPLELPKLPRAFSGFRLAQISDIHLGEWMTVDRLLRVLAMVEETRPDAIAMTGDFVVGMDKALIRREFFLLTEAMSGLARRIPTFAVMGNHDYWLDSQLVKGWLSEMGVIELSNDVHVFERDDEKFYLAGVDDHWEGHDDLPTVVGQLPPDACAVLMAHEPDFADTSAATGRFALQISGHSHGGQVVIPFLGPPLLPPLGRKYPSGLYQVGEMFQYTNRGVGMVTPAVRFLCPPEITVFTFSPGAV